MKKDRKNTATVKTVEQPDIVGQVFHNLGGDIPLSDIQRIIMAEQAAVENFLAKGYRVSKYGYMVLYTSRVKPRKLNCPLDGKEYDLPETVLVNVRIGEKLKRAVQAQTSLPVGKKHSKTARVGAVNSADANRATITRGTRSGQHGVQTG